MIVATVLAAIVMVVTGFRFVRDANDKTLLVFLASWFVALVLASLAL